MSYCTAAQVRLRNPTFLAASVLSDSDIGEYITYAEGIVDGYLCSRYPVPLTTVPVLISALTADYAAGLALRDKVGDRGENGEPKQALNLRSGAEKTLGKIAEGKLGLTNKPRAVVAKTTSYGTDGKFESWDLTDYDTYA